MQRHGFESMLIVLALLLSAVYILFAWKYVTYITDTAGAKLEAHSEQLARMIELTTHVRARMSGEFRIPYAFGSLTPAVSILKKTVPFLRLEEESAKKEYILREHEIYSPADEIIESQYPAGEGILIMSEKKTSITRIPGCTQLQKMPRTLMQLAQMLSEKQIILHVHPSITEENWKRQSLLILPKTRCILPGERIAVLPLPENDPIITSLRESMTWWDPVGRKSEKMYDAYLIPLVRPIKS